MIIAQQKFACVFLRSSVGASVNPLTSSLVSSNFLLKRVIRLSESNWEQHSIDGSSQYRCSLYIFIVTPGAGLGQ